MAHTVWFEGEDKISCDLDQLTQAVANLGEYFAGVVSLMPGLSSVELVERQNDPVTIRANEGLMKRTNILTKVQPDSVVFEFDEEYEAGSKVTTNSHFCHRFVANDQGLTHALTIRDVSAPGLLGFFYRRFGSSKMGNAFLTAHKAYLEENGMMEAIRRFPRVRIFRFPTSWAPSPNRCS